MVSTTIDPRQLLVRLNIGEQSAYRAFPLLALRMHGVTSYRLNEGSGPSSAKILLLLLPKR